MLVYFGYTFCPTPVRSASPWSRRSTCSARAAKQVVPIFITVDPDRDTVTQMAKYAAHSIPAWWR